MNGQQSPSAPDPKVPQPTHRLSRWRREPGLSDQEAFALLAESMADDRNGHAAHSGRPDANGHAARNGHVARNGRPDANGNGPNGRNGHGLNGVTSTARREIRPDMPPVVPFRIASLEIDGARAGDQPTGGPEYPMNGRHVDWSTPILVDEQWELIDTPNDVDPIHGHVTEVIDLTQVPPVVITTDPNDHIAAAESSVAIEDPSVEAPVSSEDRSASTNRILPPVEESNDAESLPPLVFLNTRGDILPRVGESSNGGNDDTFERAEAACDGVESPVATTTSASGVENMADPRGDIEATTQTDSAVDPTVDFVEPELINATDTQVLPPRPTPVAPIGHPADSPAVALDSGQDPAPMAPTTPNGADVDPDLRLDELQRVFDQYSGPVIAVIASIAGDRRAIDEALQSTFEAVWKAVDSFDPEQPRGPWMFTLARRQATEQVELARRLDQESKPGRYPVPSHRHDEAIAVDKSWEAWEVRLAVDQLTRAEHDVLRLIHNEGLIHPEIAAQLHTTVGAVKSHAYSGSHRLVELLDHVIRPEATDGLTIDQASALTWYLAGVADGSDLGTEERSAIKRVQGQLASATAWINPDAHARERVLSFARRTLDDPGPLASGEHRGLAHLTAAAGASAIDQARPEVTGRHSAVPEPNTVDRRPWLIVGLSAVGLLALVAAFSFRSGSTEAEPDAVRRYQMQPSGLDADVTGVVEIATAPTGSRYELSFGGLDASTDEFFYTAWLQSTAGGGVVPLGSFSWQAAGDALVLSGPSWSDAYDLLVVTRSEPMTQASINDPAVLSVSIE